MTSDDTFRAEARAWLDAHVAPYRVMVDRDSPSLVFADVSDTEHVERGRAWQRELFDGGYAGLGWPTEHGGRGLPISHRVAWAQEAAAAGVPPGINLIGESIVGPALIAHGTEEQKLRYLRPMLRGDEIWCQLFSEPEAGSDIAAVRTSAERQNAGRGGGWRVSGHKLWASAAHYADFGLLLARSDWHVPKHEGCTCFAVDMRAPGIRTQPLRQMTGGAAFNEVFLEGVSIADSERVGTEGEGWAVARTTLWSERLNLGLGVARVAGGVDRILRDFAASAVSADPVARQVAAQLYVESRCLQYLGEEAVAKLERGEMPGPEGTLAKLASTRVSRRSDELLDAMRGAGAMVWDDYSLVQLWVPATMIAGGTDEVLRTIVAERVLGLPRPPRADKDVPFADLVEGTT
ncbi:MAG: acyl-CoA dehydrogenase family protein [Acidimicrobiales bacterium]